MVAPTRAAMWWIDRWRKSTAYTDMTLAEQGAYRNLLDECWLREDGAIPDDPRILSRACGDPRAWPKVKENVLKHFRLTIQGWVNDTQIEVRSWRGKQAIKGKARAEAASRSAGGTFQPKDQPDHQPEDQPLLQPPDPYPGIQIPPTPQGGAVAAPPKKERKVGAQEQAASLLAAKLGSSKRVCRQQVAALVGEGWTVERITGAVHVHAAAAVSPWEWTRRVKAAIEKPVASNAEAYAYLRASGQEHMLPEHARTA